MKLSDLEGFNLYKNFETKILKEVRVDDISNLFGEDQVVYIVANLFTDKLLNERQVNFRGNTAEIKKRTVASKIPNLFKIVSFDYSDKYQIFFSPSFKEDEILHFPILRINKLFDRLFQVVTLLFYLFKERNNYDRILFYNFLPHTSLAPLMIHFMLGKKLVVDFEDNYNKFYLRHVRKFVSKYIEGALLVNENQKELLTNTEVKISVINTFAKLEYVRSQLDKEIENLKIIYSGKIDRLRGADLIPKFSYLLSQRNIDHKIFITGYGDFKEVVANSNFRDTIEENVKYLGYVSKQHLNDLLTSANLALSFDKPDIKANRYLYPSKIQMYTKYNLPVLILGND